MEEEGDGPEIVLNANFSYLEAVFLPVARCHLEDSRHEPQMIGCILALASLRPAGQQVATLSCQDGHEQQSRRRQVQNIFYQ